MQKKRGRKHFRERLDEMIHTLKEDIISGKLAIDTYLPSESDLESRFQLSNSSVRKGLEVLVQEGLIVKIPRVGNRVTSPAPEQVTTIRFGYQNNAGNQIGMDELLKQFHKQYPHVQVQPLELPTSRYGHAIMEYMEAEMLDVVMINNNNFEDFVENDSTSLLEPLPVSDEYYPFLTEPFQSGRETLIQPFIFSPVILCYNRDHFREMKVPEPDSSWTWMELFRQASKLAVKNERFGFYFHLPSRNRWPVFMLQSGASFTPDADGKYVMCGTKLVNGLEMCRELITQTDIFPMVLSESNADVEALFLEGKVSVIMTTYFFLNELKKAKPSFDVAPLPGFINANTLLVISGLAVNSKSRHKEAARLLVQFLASYETQLHIRRTTLNIPAHRLVSEWQGEEQIYRPSRFFMYREIIPTFRLIQDLGLQNRQLKEIQREVLLYISGFLESETLCKNVEAVLNGLKPVHPVHS
ncbi:extracellular solute-binding protein [Paenibacillus allorhizosphaerae]|uniref:HTH gntR-type domain-containing protein n=1 Tax=Paenibacillus allorhizosphaerae TaxID=2849866 RepID=A0ABN7TN62_9BACL|nr:extracellular solute-binding protein [Paenibacillus allorhizosphaerae]CAG7642693.1 hypothetical protein PAECIP111802_02890 [Paenibacillus allorhizosphaerae]